MEAHKNAFMYYKNPKVNTLIELCHRYMDQIIHGIEEAEKTEKAQAAK